jgi:hypothetical protein
VGLPLGRVFCFKLKLTYVHMHGLKEILRTFIINRRANMSTSECCVFGGTDLALPTLPNIIVSLAFLFVGAPIVYLLARGLKLRPKPIVIAAPGREAKMTFFVIVIVYVATALLAVFDYVVMSYRESPWTRWRVLSCCFLWACSSDTWCGEPRMLYLLRSSISSTTGA